MTYNIARQEERPVQDNRAKAQTEKLMEDKAGKTAKEYKKTKGDGLSRWSHGS